MIYKSSCQVILRTDENRKPFMTVYNEIRDKVGFLLQEASTKFILPFYKNLSAEQISTKSSKDDFVTVADRKSEVFLAKNLIQLINGSNVIGEEACYDDKNNLSRLRDNIVWTVDPIDGTKNFVNGNERFCSMVALLKDGKPQASWIFIPLANKCYYADASGLQVRHNSDSFQPLEISNEKMMSTHVTDFKCSVSLRHLEPEIKTLVKNKVKHLKNRVFIGSAGIEATMLAQGQIDFIFHSNTTAWDHAPVDMFCKASGGNSGQINLFLGSYSDFNIKKNVPVLFVQNKYAWDEVASYIVG